MIGRLRRLTSRRRGTASADVRAAGLNSAAVPQAVHHGEPVNGFAVLQAALALPVSTWRYHWDPKDVHHLGPMAQDWWKAFGVGDNDTTICCTDTNGVAIVCIQALHRLLEEARQETAQLRHRLDRLEQTERATPT